MAIGHLQSEPGPVPTDAAGQAVSVSEIDRSCRGPLLSLVTAGLTWLAVGVGLLLLACIKLHGPGFLAEAAWLSYGRVAPAGLNAVLYGFACPVALGLGLWLLARLGRVRLLGGGAVWIGAAGWNFGVLLGVAGILAGHSTGFSWLEMPGRVWPILLISVVVVGVWGLVALAARSERALYPSQWYGLVLVLGLPWIGSAAQWLLVHRPVRGVVQAVVAAWYRGVLLEVCLTAAGLAMLFYFIPKLVGRPLYSRGLAAFSFWVLVLGGGWTGCRHLLGGPVPAWMISASTAATGLLLAGAVAVGLNLWRTVYRPGQSSPRGDLTLRYMAFGAGCYLIASVLAAVLSSRSVSGLTRFTYVETGREWLMLLGFWGMAALGAVHDLVPRLAGRPWPWPQLARAHFWGSALGVGLIWLGLTAGGLVQGIKLLDASVPATAAARASAPFVGLASLGWLALLLAQMALLTNLGAILAGLTAPLWRAARDLVQQVEPTATAPIDAKR